MNSPTENVAKWLDPPPNKNPTRPTKRRFFLVNFPIFLDRKYNKSLNIIVLTSKNYCPTFMLI